MTAFIFHRTSNQTPVPLLPDAKSFYNRRAKRCELRASCCVRMKQTLTQIICFLVLTILITSCSYRRAKNEEDCKQQDYKGVVLEKYQDWDNHGAECVKILNNNTDTVIVYLADWRYDHIWGYVKVGDSLIKPQGLLSITIVRKHETPQKFRYLMAGI